LIWKKAGQKTGLFIAVPGEHDGARFDAREFVLGFLKAAAKPRRLIA
jgi:hypothetical protein